MISLQNNKISRKEFLAFVGSFFAFLALAKITSAGRTVDFFKKTNQGTYNNLSYGGDESRRQK